VRSTSPSHRLGRIGSYRFSFLRNRYSRLHDFGTSHRLDKKGTRRPAHTERKLVLLRQPIDYLEGAFSELSDATTSASPNKNLPTVALKDPPAVASQLAWITVTMLARLFKTMIILFFLLAAGDRLLRGLIEVLPRFSDKRQAVDISSEIQRQIGGYLFTITVMNAAVGLVTGLAMWACGLGDPILWGSAAFLMRAHPRSTGWRWHVLGGGARNP
jgi:hypothetical protein